MYANNKMVLHMISLLKQFGIRKIVVSPGCRHIPFVHSLEQDEDFELFLVVDERSAAFFALGLIQQSGEPVAVTCTSGTACQNYGSALVEAYYQRLPLLVLSGDRLDALLNQNEDQMYDQVNSFRHCTKYQVKLPNIQSELDEWHCNRLINEALLELTTHGNGPVHISFPIIDHFNVSYDSVLPVARKITWHKLDDEEEVWMSEVEKLKSKHILIVWGQAVPMTAGLKIAVEEFCRVFDATILTDKITNCHISDSIQNTWVLLNYMNSEDLKELRPDVVIKVGSTNFFNMNMKIFVQKSKAQHWQIGEYPKVCDEYRSLTDVYEMKECSFFQKMVELCDFENVCDYRNAWNRLSELPELPETEFNERYAIGALMTRIPSGTDLQLANSMTIRFSNLFALPHDVSVNCNRALSGIDGSMSTAIGYAAISQRPLFYITGDLSFFYDMNSLSIRHLSPRLRILLINNNGGACLWHGDDSRTNGNLPIYCASNGKVTEAKRWVESCGFKYYSASNKNELDENIKYLVDTESEGPVFLEVFTEMTSDYDSLGAYINVEKAKHAIVLPQPSFKMRVKDKIASVVGANRIQAAKTLIKG